MGKKSSNPPPAPDPVQVANAQSASNIQTAEAQQRLNMIGTAGPQGTVMYGADPTQPGGYTQTTTLSPAEQAIYDAQKRTELGATNIAYDQLGRVQGALQTPLSTDGLPALQGGVQPGQIQAGFNGGPPVRTGFDTAGQVERSYDPAGQVASGYSTGGPIERGFDPAGQVQRQIGPTGQVQQQLGPSGQIQTDAGLQYGFDRGGALQYGFDPGQQVQGQVGGDLNAARQQQIDAVYGQATSRLDPQFAQAENRERTRLANMGFSENSQGFKDAMAEFGRTRNDAYNQANFSSIGAGEQAAQALFGRQLGQGQFANDAAAQMYGQNMGQAAFNNQTAGQDYTQNRGLAEFGNEAALAAGQFRNQAQQQGFGQNLDRFAAENAAQQQQFGQAVDRLGVENAAQAQQYGQNLGGFQARNQAQQQQFGQNQAAFQDRNAAQAQQFGQNQAGFQDRNAAQAQQYAQNQDAAAFANAGYAQQFGQNQQQAAFGNNAQNQGFNQGMAGAQLSNTARQQGLQERAYLANTPINQLTGLLSLGQVGMPQGVQYTPSQVAPTDYIGAQALSTQAQQAAYNARAQQQSGLMNGLFSLGSAAIMASDARLKGDVETVGYDDQGVRWVDFSYLGEPHVRRRGVIAQELRRIRPDLVLKRRDGSLAVNYAGLAFPSRRNASLRSASGRERVSP